jgi:3-oxoacyl-[acyl-carrier-protein] synthase-3
MAKLVGYGICVPCYRVAAAEINGAWGRPGGRGEKAVAPPDEDPLTLGVKAAKAALEQAGIEGSQLDLVYFASISTGYSEGAFAAQLAHHLGAEGDLLAGDLGLSTRSVTAALRACMDAVDAGRARYGLVVAGERLIAKPGSSYELSYGAGAGALLISNEGFAAIEGFTSHTSGFVGRFRREGADHGITDERFVMKHGFLEHTGKAVEGLLNVLDVTPEAFDHIVLHAPEGRWGVRALKVLGLPRERLVSTFAHIGYAGCASLLIDLALAFERAEPGQRILAASYGPGGSDAVALQIHVSPLKAEVEDQLEEKELVSYVEYLRYCGLLGGGR